METQQAEPGVLARDVLVRVADHADRYGIHAALDEHYGRRGAVGFLWSLGRLPEGQAVRVRLPLSHPAAPSSVLVRSPLTGDKLQFRLCANITRKVGRSNSRVSWPLDEIGPRLRWLERRAAEQGFHVDAVTTKTGRTFIRKGRGFWIDETMFVGELTVIGADAFAAALAGGVGQRQTFGFGLLETF